VREVDAASAAIHAGFVGSSGDAAWQRAAGALAKLNLTRLYPTDADLRPVAQRRGDAIEFVLRLNGFPIDHTFAERPPSGRRRIRVGVTEGRIGPRTGSYVMLPMFEHLPRDRFEVIAYASASARPEADEPFSPRVERAVRLSDDVREIVAGVRGDDLDVLVLADNLSGSPHRWAKVAAHRLARVQLTNFSCPITSGLRNVDYFISGTLAEPPPAEREAHYRERVVLLDGCGFALDVSRTPHATARAGDSAAVSRAALGLAPDAVVFASTANYYKIVPELLDAWARVVAATPHAALLLVPFGPMWSNTYPTEEFVARATAALRRAGSDAPLLVAPMLPSRAQVQALLRGAAVDVYLDSFPHTGSHSLFDAMELGIPCVSLLGRTLRGRHGPALLLELDLPESVASGVDGYERTAVQLGRDAAMRDAFRRRTLDALRRPPLFLDPPRFGARMAELYEQLLAGAGSG
jgi:predicted O-linked N-acetylglucosamine transferase (SPINDLY family)